MIGWFSLRIWGLQVANEMGYESSVSRGEMQQGGSNGGTLLSFLMRINGDIVSSPISTDVGWF